MKVVYLVIPCLNEEEVLPEAAKRITEKLSQIISDGKASPESRILFVDDGSRDRTWEMIAELHITNPYICGLKLSRNQGHQKALLAGLLTAKDLCDCTISLDADLQDDIEVIGEFIDQYNGGCEVVYGVRKKRDKDTIFKRTTAVLFYKFMRSMGVDIIYNHADYRLLSRKALDALSEFGEVNLFLRGIVPLIGFKSSTVLYDRNERFAGKSKYPLKKMLAFAFDGITSFSIKPIRLISALGLIVFLCSIAALIYALISRLTGNAQAGWATTVGSIWMLGGIQLLALGICGEYIGKIYSEVKSRPLYIIEQFIKK
jgi:glycosyltransferase involved in cell wall biosynthesis